MVSSAATILRPLVRIPSTTSVLFSNCNVEIETEIDVAMRKARKQNKKRPGLVKNITD